MTIALNWGNVCQKFLAKIRMFESKFDATARALLEQIDKELLKEDERLLHMTPDGKFWSLDIEDDDFLKLHQANIDRWYKQLNQYLKTHTQGKLHIEAIDEDYITITYSMS